MELAQPLVSDLSLLPRSNPRDGHFLQPHFTLTTSGEKLYIASLPTNIIAGHQPRVGPLTRQHLLIQHLTHTDDYHHTTLNVTQTLDFRFFWVNPGSTVPVQANIIWRGNTGRHKHSMCITVYTDEGVREKLIAHRIVGFTFGCNPRFYTQLWSEDLDVDHHDQNHFNTTISNLNVRVGPGAGGHRAEAGSLGGLAKRRRVQRGCLWTGARV